MVGRVVVRVLDRHANDVAAISVAGQQHGHGRARRRRRVLRPAKLWNDTESAPDADCARRRSCGAAARGPSACGTVPVASFTITKLAWLREHEPDAFGRGSRTCCSPTTG